MTPKCPSFSLQVSPRGVSPRIHESVVEKTGEDWQRRRKRRRRRSTDDHQGTTGFQLLSFVVAELSAMLAARNIKGECPDNVEIERDSRQEPEWHLKSFVLRDVMSGSPAGTMEEGQRKTQLEIQKG